MQLAVNRGRLVNLAAKAWLIAAALLALGPMAGSAMAESAYIPQLGPSGMSPPLSVATSPTLPEMSSSLLSIPSVVLPGFAPLSKSTRNVAQTVVFGNHDQTVQVQLGMNDQSALGVLGSNDTAGVFQVGNNLRSNIAVLGQGLSVGVIEPNGSPPVDMLVVRLPSGRLLIAR